MNAATNADRIWKINRVNDLNAHIREMEANAQAATESEMAILRKFIDGMKSDRDFLARNIHNPAF